MNEDQVKGVGEKVKGKINEGVGKMTDDPAQEAKGDLCSRFCSRPSHRHAALITIRFCVSQRHHFLTCQIVDFLTLEVHVVSHQPDARAGNERANPHDRRHTKSRGRLPR